MNSKSKSMIFKCKIVIFNYSQRILMNYMIVRDFIDFQMKNIGDQGYDRMGDLLQQLGGLGMSYGINKAIG